MKIPASPDRACSAVRAFATRLGDRLSRAAVRTEIGLFGFFRATVLILCLSSGVVGRAQSDRLRSSVPSVPALEELAGDWQTVTGIRSMPALNNSRGSAQALRDALAVGILSFPPITMTGETGGLRIDGENPVLSEARWYPYQVVRKASAKDLRVETMVRMPYDERGVMFHLVITNVGTEPRTFTAAIELTASTSRHERWGWKLPRPQQSGRFSAQSVEGRLLALRDSHGELANCFAFETRPDELVTRADVGQSTWRITLRPGESRSLNYVLAIGEKDDVVRSLASAWATHFEATFAQVPRDWQQRFDAMFTPGNHIFSGHLPVLATRDAELRRVYYMSIVSLLSVLRTGFPVEPRVYVSNTPESNCTMMYFWDTREWATVLALLDPAMLKNYLAGWLARGIDHGYAEEYLTGTLQGPWYSANDYSVFVLLDAYLNVTGDRAFLGESIAGKTVLAHLDAIATHWKSLVKPGRTLADYGGVANLLECVPTYINEVASFNAANVWMMRRTAEIQQALGHDARARELRADAARLLPAVLALYVPGQGVWDAYHADGSRVPIRHVFDYATVGLTIAGDLSSAMRNEMTGFVENELLTDHWMRAQSLSDPAADVSDRPDHGPMGAYCAWPAETIATMCQFGQFDQALDLLHRCAAVTREGPFSQSRELMSRTHDGPVRINERGSGGLPTQTYNASNGGGFAEAIIRGLFGYEPDWVEKVFVPHRQPRGFEGRLFGMRQGADRFDLASTETGIEVALKK